MRNEVLRMQDVTVKLDNHLLLDHLNLNLFEKELVYLLNPLKSGQHALEKVFSGVCVFQGQVYFHDIPVSSLQPLSSRGEIFILRQEMSLFSELTVAENVFIGIKLRKKPSLFNRKMLNLKAEVILSAIPLEFNVSIKAKNLSVFEQHMVLLAKALQMHPQLIVINSPMYSYTLAEQKLFIHVLSTLREMNIAVLYLTPAIDDILQHADRAIVINNGKKVYTFNAPDNLTKYDLFKLLRTPTKNSLDAITNSIGKTLQAEILSVKHISYGTIKDMNFRLAKGETMCIYDMDSSHVDSLSTIFSFESASFVEKIFLEGKPCPRHAIQSRQICYLPMGFVYCDTFNNLTILENIILTGNFRSLHFNTSIDRALSKDIEEILGFSPEQQQESMATQNVYTRLKAILFRYYLIAPKVIIFDQPFNHMDFICSELLQQFFEMYSRKGISIIFWTTDHTPLQDSVNSLYSFQNDQLVQIQAWQHR